MSKRFKILFTLSVLLNVLLLGLSGGMFYKHNQWRSWEQVKDGLSPETRNLMAREFQSAHKDMAPLREEAKAARKGVMDALSQDEFNEKTFDTAMKRLEAAQKAIMVQKIEATKRLAAELPADERRKLAEHFSSSLSGRYGRPPGSWGRDGGKYNFPRPPEGAPPPPSSGD